MLSTDRTKCCVIKYFLCFWNENQNEVNTIQPI